MTTTLTDPARVTLERELDPRTFVFAGIVFDVHPTPELRFTLDDEHRLFRSLSVPGSRFDAEGLLARVRCVVGVAPELEAHYDREIAWVWEGEVARLRTGGARAELRDLGGGELAATALVSPDSRGCSSLCTLLAGAIAFRLGGLVLHASAIEVDGRAILFIGPSGAGKTTSANHCGGARWLARDRAVVFPSGGQWWAAGMCGGDPIDAPRSSAAVLPLGGVLRVEKASSPAATAIEPAASAIEPAGAMAALVRVRESVQTAAGDAAAEAILANRILELAAEAPIGVLSAVLGEELTPVLRRWMSNGRSMRDGRSMSEDRA